MTPLETAQHRGHADVVQALQRGREIASARETNADLLPSIVADRVDMVKALVGASGDPEQLFQGSHRALHIAVERGDWAMVEALQELGVNIESTTSQGYTALTVAAMNDKGEIARMLITAHASLGRTMGLNRGDAEHRACECRSGDTERVHTAHTWPLHASRVRLLRSSSRPARMSMRKPHPYSGSGRGASRTTASCWPS
jgi:hypothetical protein